MKGPFTTFDACPAPTAGAITKLGDRKTGGTFRTITLVQYGEADGAQCAVAIQLDDGWYLGHDFTCATQDSQSYSTTTDVHIDVRNADTSMPDARIRYRMDRTYASADEDRRQYEIDCTIASGQPACSDPAMLPE